MQLPTSLLSTNGIERGYMGPGEGQGVLDQRVERVTVVQGEWHVDVHCVLPFDMRNSPHASLVQRWVVYRRWHGQRRRQGWQLPVCGFGQRYPAADLQRPDLFFCVGCSLSGVSSSELAYSTSPTDARFIHGWNGQFREDLIITPTKE